MSALAPSLQAYFTDRLISQRAASPNTIAAYKLTLRLLLAFAAGKTGKAPSALDIADLGIRTAAVRPRVHDLRHSFAVQTLVRWQRARVNVDERIGALSTYLGHVAPADTYWYLSASPELMSLAAGRLAELEARQ